MTHRRIAGGLAALFALGLVGILHAEPLPQDERIQTGKLENGVTWMYRQHGNPPGKMALMVHVRTGSLNESDEQRGLAHFIEHMCFNGTENHPPGTLIKYFESIGMEFGADLNAFTGFDQTAYMLFLPDTEEGTIDKGVMTLSDYVFRALLVDEEIDKERGVVLSEWRSGQSAMQRVRDEELKQVFAGTHFAQRLPIGVPEVIEKAPREEFVKYYETWYRPEHVTIMAVGDAPLERAKPAIEKWFGEVKAKAPAGEPQSAGFKPFAEERAFVITDPELGATSIEVTAIEAGRPPITTVAQARVELVDYVGSWIVNRRYHERVQKGEASYNGASASVRDIINEALIVTASATGDAEDWAKMVDELIAEIVRARAHGFSEREFELARKEILADAERAVETESTRNARSFLFEMNQAVNDREPITSAAQDLALQQRLLPTITLEEVNAAFKDHYGDKSFAYIVNMPAKEGTTAPAVEEVLKVAKAALDRSTDALEVGDTPTDLLAAEPTPGKVVETEVDEDLQIASGWLENGIRVHHRFMDYKKDTVMVSILLAGGRIEETNDTLGLTEVAATALRSQPATSRLTSTHVRDLMTGVNIGVRVGAAEDSFDVRVSGSPKALETGLQLAHALLTDGKIEDSAVKVWKQRDQQRRAMLKSMPEFQAFEVLAKDLYGGDPRHLPMLPEERVKAISAADAQAWFDRIRTTAPIEVAVVGEIQREDAMRLVEKYLGSLAQRERSATALDGLRKVNRAEGPLVRHVTVETVTPKAMAIAGFVGCHERSVFDNRALELASNVLSSRLVEAIRENLGLVYSLRAGNRPSVAYEDAGTFGTMTPCEPEKTAQVVAEIKKVYDAFRADGPTDEELGNAKKQIANHLDVEMREPGYWLGVLRDLHYHTRSLADEKAEATAYEKYSVEDIVNVFRKYYTPQRTFEVTAVPAPADTSATKDQQPVDQPSS
jgi:zinc protease